MKFEEKGKDLVITMRAKAYLVVAYSLVGIMFFMCYALLHCATNH